MAGVQLILGVTLCSFAGGLVGFAAGLVPGLHMNNIAAAMTAYSSMVLAMFALLAQVFESADASILVACFLSAALVGHLFAESITSTYLGIPAGDVVSVLPAHRLARAGLGSEAVRASADGSLAGVLVASALLLPTCLLMGGPMGLYRVLASVMGYVLLFFAAILLLSEGAGRRGRRRALSIVKAVLIFSSSGLLGVIVLCSEFYACRIPEIPFRDPTFVLRSSLLLPLFAGLYGVPGLMLGFRSRVVSDSDVLRGNPSSHPPTFRDWLTAVLGGVLVGWMPGMTAGSSATICSPSTNDSSAETELKGSLRFIWLYSSISATGSVFALGALFVLARARSGCMDAAQFFLGGRIEPGRLGGGFELMAMMLLAMVTAAWLGHLIVSWLNPRVHRVRAAMCSPALGIASLAFVCSLSVLLTGTRGALVIATATCLGLIPPITGTRRIQLMGCLLVPITLRFFHLV